MQMFEIDTRSLKLVYRKGPNNLIMSNLWCTSQVHWPWMHLSFALSISFFYSKLFKKIDKTDNKICQTSPFFDSKVS